MTIRMRNTLCFVISLSCLLYVVNGYSTNWLVGPTRAKTMPSQVSALVQSGDTVSIDAGTYTGDVAHWTANNLLLRGVGGMAKLDANNTAYGRKGIWVIGGDKNKVEYIEFLHCHDVPGLDLNWAGIRLEAANITISHCYFHDNDDGILGGIVNQGKIVIEFSEFNHNGYGDGYSHNLYITNVDTLIFRYNYSHHATVGHELKSRAHVNYILYNRLSNEATGDASREMDLPNGGMAIIMGNVIEQGPSTQNSGIVGYGLEGLSNPAPQNFYFINNTVVNDKSNGTFISFQAGTNIFKAYNNIFAGSGTLLSGSATTTDTSKNWRVTNLASCGFVNAAGYDYHLAAGSGAINAGTSAGTASNGYSLTASLEYVHPASNAVRNVSGTIDIGAHEYTAATGVNEISTLQNEFQYWMGEENIICATSLSFLQVNIFDMNGRKIIAQKISKGNSAIDVKSLAKGIYIIEAISGDQVVSGKFIR